MNKKTVKTLIFISYAIIILLQIFFATPYRKCHIFEDAGTSVTTYRGYTSLYSILSYENGKKNNFMYIDYCIAIPQFLATTGIAAFLYKKADKKEKFSPAEQELLHLYSSLSTTDKAKALLYVVELSENKH